MYVISNVGTFGPNVVKIGMTRRLEPRDRIRELGDASVPFLYDVHALFFSDDAISLENQLHKTFADRRVNHVNLRREFFFADTTDEVRVVLAEEVGGLLEYNDTPEAPSGSISSPGDPGRRSTEIRDGRAGRVNAASSVAVPAESPRRRDVRAISAAAAGALNACRWRGKHSSYPAVVNREIRIVHPDGRCYRVVAAPEMRGSRLGSWAPDSSSVPAWASMRMLGSSRSSQPGSHQLRVAEQLHGRRDHHHPDDGGVVDEDGGGQADAEHLPGDGLLAEHEGEEDGDQ